MKQKYERQSARERLPRAGQQREGRQIGKIIPGDRGHLPQGQVPGLSFFPLKQEIVEGEIVEITDFAPS